MTNKKRPKVSGLEIGKGRKGNGKLNSMGEAEIIR